LHMQESKYFPCLADARSGLNPNQIGVIMNQIDAFPAMDAFIHRSAFEGFYRIVQIEDKGIQLEFYTTPNRFVSASDHTLATFKFKKE